MALCSVCHWAYDAGEWVFVPNDMAEWKVEVVARPRIIFEYNEKKDIVYRRVLLIADPDTAAFYDEAYQSAFSTHATMGWSGEVGVVMLRPLPDNPYNASPEVKRSWNDFKAIRDLWGDYEDQCRNESCDLCHMDNNDQDSGLKDGISDSATSDEDLSDNHGSQENEVEEKTN